MFIKTHVISEPRLPPVLAQFTSGGRREPGDEASHTVQCLKSQHEHCKNMDFMMCGLYRETYPKNPWPYNYTCTFDCILLLTQREGGNWLVPHAILVTCI